MTKEYLTESQLRKRLRKAGKKPKEINKLIDKYIDVESDKAFDREAISDLLRKGQEDRILYVGKFKMTPEQYNALLSYYEESSKQNLGQQVDAKSLVLKALEEFTNLIS